MRSPDWPRPVDRLFGVGTAVLAVLAAVTIFTVIRWMVAYAYPLPFWDQWDFFRSYQLFVAAAQPGEPSSGDWLRFLWSQHNEHRIAIARLFYIADYAWFDAGNRLLLATNLVLQALTIAAIWLMTRGLVTGSRQRVLLAAATVIVLASAAQGENFIWGFQVLFIGVYTAAAWAALMAMRGRWSWAIAAGLVCTLMMSNGVVVWPMLIGMAICLRASRTTVAACVVAAVMCIGAYLWGYQSVAGHTSLSEALSRPGHLVVYILAYLGGHVGIGNVPLSAVIGGLYLALYLTCLGALFIWRPRATGTLIALLGLASFVLATACLTASGRVGFGLQQALSGRYATPSALFAVCVLLSGLAWLQIWRQAEWGPARDTAAQEVRQWQVVRIFAASALAQLCFVTLVLSQAMHYRAESNWRHRHHLATIASAAIASGVADRDALAYAHPQVSRLAETALWLRAGHKSIFSTAPWSMPGKQIGADIPLAAADRCTGQATPGVTLPADSFPASRRWSGWAWDAVAARRPDHILLARPDGRVVAVASRHDSALDRRADADKPGLGGSGWSGAAALEHESLRAFGLVDGLSRACALTSP